MISASDRIKAVELIDEARAAGARLKPACKILGISVRAYERWTQDGSVKKDQRPIIKRSTPQNKLSEKERNEIIEVVNSPDFADLPPCSIVPLLADQGRYIASESTFYRILREEQMNAHRSRSKEPIKREIPTHIATSPNQVWSWDITWMNAEIKGHYYDSTAETNRSGMFETVVGIEPEITLDSGDPPPNATEF